jgi:GTP-binding protein Era
MSFGTIAIVGRSNVGKSTFLNRVLGEDLAIVSRLPQTTRDTLLGVVSHGGAQLAFLDTPGLHQPKSELGRRMNAAALEAARGADVILFVSDVGFLLEKKSGAGKARKAGAGSPEARLHPEDAALLERLAGRAPMVLALNKVDLLRDKGQLLPLIDAFSKRGFEAVVPMSLLRDDGGAEQVLRELARLVPEGPKGFDEETLTDRPMSFFAREYVREQVLQNARAEVPHAVAVTVDRFEESAKSAQIAVTLHVEKVGQRKILIGRGGSGLRAIREGAQARIGALLGRPVRLELFVRVTPRWKNVPRQLAELGYDATQAPAEPRKTRRAAAGPPGRARRART